MVGTTVHILNVRLGRNLVHCRKALALTQEQLAHRLGVETETISRFERGATLPSLKTLEKMASILNVRMTDLLDESQPEPCDETLMMHAWLQQLAPQDKEFVLKQLKTLCDHLSNNGGK